MNPAALTTQDATSVEQVLTATAKDGRLQGWVVPTASWGEEMPYTVVFFCPEFPAYMATAENAEQALEYATKDAFGECYHVTSLEEGFTALERGRPACMDDLYGPGNWA